MTEHASDTFPAGAGDGLGPQSGRAQAPLESCAPLLLCLIRGTRQVGAVQAAVKGERTVRTPARYRDDSPSFGQSARARAVARCLCSRRGCGRLHRGLRRVGCRQPRSDAR